MYIVLLFLVHCALLVYNTVTLHAVMLCLPSYRIAGIFQQGKFSSSSFQNESLEQNLTKWVWLTVVMNGADEAKTEIKLTKIRFLLETNI